MFTPWGAPVQTLRLEPGITAVLTARHGGLVLARGYAERHLSGPARARAIRFGEYYTFEIGYAWAMPMLELPHLRAAFRSFAKLEQQSTSTPDLRRILLAQHPDYLAEIDAQQSSVPPAAAATRALSTESR